MMNKKTLRIKAATIRWHQFSRKSDAVFRSLGREIVISTLSVATLLFATPQTAQAQTNAKNPAQAEREQMLDEVEVTAARLPLPMEQTARLVSVMTHEQIKDCPAQSVNDLLKYAASVDVRQRGAFGIQTDISINGGTHDQIVILLNGVYFSSPHTGHLAADLPISIDDIERIEILEGAASRVYGTSAFSGAINIVTKGRPASFPLPAGEGSDDSVNGKTSVGGSLSLQGGSFGTFGTDGRVGLQTSHFSHSLSTGYTQSDGGTDNSDFNRFRAFYQGNYSHPYREGLGDRGASVSWQLGLSRQDYGANTFYSGRYPNQYEETRRYSGSVSARVPLFANAGNQVRTTLAHSEFEGGVYFSRSYDHYQLIRNTPTGENFHRTDVYGLTLNAHSDWALGMTSIGADFRNEGILSSSLGRPIASATVSSGSAAGNKYTKRDNRTNLCYFLEHDILLRRWTFSLGVMANMNTGLDDRFRLYPGIDVSYRPSSLWRLFASWNTAQRMPTFTDLYYRSPTQEGNLGLKPEETSEVSLGSNLRIRGLNTSVKLFYRHNSSMIDWVLTPADSINGFTTYHATNFSLDNMGATLNAEVLFREWLGHDFPLASLILNYNYLHQRRRDHQEIYASSYALDYLRQKLVVRLDSRLTSRLHASLTYRWQERMGDFVRYTPTPSGGPAAGFVATKQRYRPYALLDLRLQWTAPRYELFVEASNLTNHRYYDLGNVLQPGIWLMAGMKAHFL